MNPGEVDGLTDEEIKVRLVFDLHECTIQMTHQGILKARFPDEIAKAQKDPYRHRYPRAEVNVSLCV